MPKKKGTIRFKGKDGNEMKRDNVDITVEADGSAKFIVPEGRIVPGTDLAIIVDGKTFRGKASTQSLGDGNLEVTLPAGTVR